MSEYILTIDVGTTAIKVAVFDSDLKCVCTEREEYSLITAASTIEMDPDGYMDAIYSAVRRMLNGRQHIADDIAAIVPTSQGETIIPVNADGKALRNAIVWLDGRAEAQAISLSEAVDTTQFYLTTGVPELTGVVPVCKVMWIREQEPHIFRNTYKILMVADWVILNLAQRFVTDKGVVTSSGYYDIINDRYYTELIRAAGLPEDLFPETVDSGTPVGIISPAAAEKLGINKNAIVMAGSMDQPAGFLAMGGMNPGVFMEATGTCLTIAASCSNPAISSNLCPVIYRDILPDSYLIEPVCMTAGVVLKWFRDEFCSEFKNDDNAFRYMDEYAQTVPPCSEGLVMLPYFSGITTPEVNPDAKGVLFGLQLGMGKPHIIRAIMEAVGYMLRENVAIIEQAAGIECTEIRSMGGGANSDLWLQMKADICNRPIVKMKYTECTSLGAAIIGAVSLKWYKSYKEAAEKGNVVEKIFKPDPHNADLYSRGFQKYQRLYASLRSLFRE